MTRVTVDILNPKAPRLLQDLADLGIIAIRDSHEIANAESHANPNSTIDYSKFKIPSSQLKFDRDEANER